MITKTVLIDGKEVKFSSSAAIPHLYRIKFGKDIFKDMLRLQESIQKNGGEDSSTIPFDDLEIFENVAFIMAKHADPSIPDDMIEWLDQFEMFSIYQVMPVILELWGQNMVTTTTAKKNSVQPTVS